jgi:hypothetical protein
VRTGDARALDAVLEHNRLDILSLAMFTARASQLLEDGPLAAATGREALGMGRLYERAGMLADAMASFCRAADMDSADATTRAESLRAHAFLCRRLRRYDEAAASWRRVVELRACPPALAREATEALAVHHEHRARDLHAARAFALRALELPATTARQQAVHYRLARLDRKLGSGSVTASTKRPLLPLGSPGL